MRKIISFVIALLWTASSLLQARTQEEASAIASQFIGQRVATIGSAKRVAAASKVTLAFTQYQIDQTTPALFIFNSGTDDGFVMVSAEDEGRTILGYSDDGHFDETNIPTNMQFWLQMYADELARYNANKQPGKPALKRAAVQTSYPTITPILGNVEWGQGEPYNNLCPTVNGERCVTGCVATAISQIMYVHKHPTKGTGSHSYTSETHQLTSSANFSATTYNWSNMLPVYTRNNYNTTQANAVATLMHHVGIVAEMDYDPEGSGANSSYTLSQMATYFGYDAGIRTLPKDYMREEEVMTAIISDLEQGHPVFVSGRTKNDEGHAFVCDGMQSDGYLHINWGWYGGSNGYFALSALDPEQQGTGGSASDMAFTEEVSIYTNIQPDKGGTAQPLVTVSKIVRTSEDRVGRNAKIAFSLERFTNSGMATAKGTICYYIYDSNDLLTTIQPIGNFELPTGHYYQNPITISYPIPSSLPDGEYKLEVGFSDGNDNQHPILAKNAGRMYFPFTIDSNSITFGEGTGSGGGSNDTPLAPITQADISYVQNSTNNTWKVDLYSSYFWTDSELDDEVLIRLEINSSSTTSVIGTYVLDTLNSGAVGTINTKGDYMVGYYQDYDYHYIDNAHLTITDAGDGQVNLEYHIEVNGKVYDESLTLTPEWFAYDKGNNQYFFYQDYITWELASTIPASRALTMTQALSHTNETAMSYFVSGIISTMRNTPEQIVQYKTARFDISDDGTTNNQFYCYNTRWLENTDFTTGNEIALGDEVIIYGPVQNYNGNTPEIKGYVYSTDKEDIDYSIKNLQVTIFGNKLYFEFESEASYFHVKITKQDGTSIVNTIIDFKQAQLNDMEEGTYTLWIRPVDEAKQYYLADPIEATFTIVDYSIYNLSVTTKGSTVTSSWESKAPHFHVIVIDSNGQEIANNIIDAKTISLTDLADGTYTLWIRPVDEALEYYAGEAVEETFTINSANTEDYSIYNLHVTIEGNTVNFSFESEAPNFHIIVINANGDEAANGIIYFKTASVTNLADGTYTLWIRPMNEDKTYYTGDAIEAQFEICTHTTNVEDISTSQIIELYDIMGRLIDSKPSSDSRLFIVPTSGVYIQRIGNTTNKIYIHQQ